MDTSAEYIEMCKKAPQIQEVWLPKDGDWIYRYDNGEFQNVYPVCSKNNHSIEIQVDGNWWLPRQDQLQDILIDATDMRIRDTKEWVKYCWVPEVLTRRCLKYALTVKCNKYYSNSITKLWLHYFMWELYKKKWSSKRKIWYKGSY